MIIFTKNINTGGKNTCHSMAIGEHKKKNGKKEKVKDTIKTYFC